MNYVRVTSISLDLLLGKGRHFKSSQIPGIAKKGGSDPCQDFFCELALVHRGYLKVIIDP